MIPEDDRGFTLGDGLFETVLVRDGAPVLWAEHMTRLAQGCARAGLPAPDPDFVWEAARRALAGAPRRAALRLSWSAGSGGRGVDRPAAPTPRLVAQAAAAPAPQGSVSLATAAVRRNEGSPASRLKTLAYLDNVLARAEARAAGADEALMLNNRGEVACAAVANLFWLQDGVLYTPALDCGVLAGVMRAALVERARASGWAVEEAKAPRSALDKIEALFLTNSLVGLRPVSALDGKPAPQADLAPLSAMLADLC